MNEMWLYLLKASLSLSLLYLVFWLFLKKETLFITNRYYLVASLVISVILPALKIYYTVNVTGDIPVASSSTFLNFTGLHNNQVSAASTGLMILATIYISGVIVFLLRIVMQFIILFRIIAQNGIVHTGDTRIVYNRRFMMPFSFINLIFINPENTRESELNDIIAHEKVHIRENHWFDLLLVELLSVILWFNPFIWFFERSIKQNHEYLADEGVIAQGYNVGRYHSVLINQLLGMEVIGITNNLNYSLNAKRLKMMKRDKTPRTKALHIVWALPAVFILMVAFATPKYVNNESSSPAGTEAVIIKDVSITAVVYDKGGDPLPGANIFVKGSKNGTTTDKEGQFTIKVKDSDILIISFIGYDDTVLEVKELAKKQGELDNYNIKLVMSRAGQDVAAKEKEIKMKKEMMAREAAEKKASQPAVKMSNEEMKIELEKKLKMLSARQEELNSMKDKISQMEKEGTADKETLEKKKVALKEEVMKLNEQRKSIESKLQSIK